MPVRNRLPTRRTKPNPAPTPAPATSVTATLGTGADALVLKISQDYYLADAQYTVAVDGVQIGGTQTARALRSSGQKDTITVRGDWATGSHTAEITFLNDDWGGTAELDRNLYVDGATYNGVAVPDSTLNLGMAGTQNFTFQDGVVETTGVTARRSANFADSIAMNVHVAYTDSSYADEDRIITQLNYLGITHIRDAWPEPQYDAVQNGHFNKVAAAGKKFCFFVRGGGGDTAINGAMTALSNMETAYPGSIHAVEGPNEVNNEPFSYNGQSGLAAYQAFQAKLFSTVKANAKLSGKPVYNYTNYPHTAGDADYGNFHSYAKSGNPPRSELKQDRDAQAAVMPNLTLVCTETGYYTLPIANVGWGGVDQATQAKFTLSSLFDNWSMGVERTYLYQLQDGYVDSNNTDQEKHFGFFTFDGTAKTAAVALKNLKALFDDTAANAFSFTPGKLNYTLSGTATGLASVLLQKANGTLYVVLWAEPDIWNQTTAQPIAAPVANITVNLGRSYSTVRRFDPMIGTAAQATANNVSSVVVPVSDHPVILEVSGPQ